MSPMAGKGQAVYLKSSQPAQKFSFAWVNWVLPLSLVLLAIVFVKNVMNDPQVLPVNKIRVTGAFVHIDEVMLHRAIDGVVAGGYFNVDVDKVKNVVETLPWVSKASVRRVWPDTLSVHVTEQKPLAVSEGRGLINAKGESFNPRKMIETAGLPVFKGKSDLNLLMIEKYASINSSLAKIGLSVNRLEMDPRQAVSLKLNNGLRLVLGKNDIETRLNRFVKIYRKLVSTRVNDIAAIDLRYTNGLAISWKIETNIQKGLR